jgi:hypothetical protein
LHRRGASSSPSRPPHQELLQAEVSAGMVDGQAGNLLVLVLIYQLPPCRRPPSPATRIEIDSLLIPEGLLPLLTHPCLDPLTKR